MTEAQIKEYKYLGVKPGGMSRYMWFETVNVKVLNMRIMANGGGVGASSLSIKVDDPEATFILSDTIKY